MPEELKLNDRQLDALKEIGTIGSGHAALALSQLIAQKVNMAVVKVEIVPSDGFNQVVGGPQTLGATIYIQMLGELRGGVILFFKRQDSLRLIDTLLRREKGKTAMLSEMGISAIKEAGNILAGSYLSAMSSVVPFKLALSTPKFAFDLIGAVMEGVFEEIMQPEKSCLSLVTEFIESNMQIHGYFVLLPKKEALEKILRDLKV